MALFTVEKSQSINTFNEFINEVSKCVRLLRDEMGYSLLEMPHLRTSFEDFVPYCSDEVPMMRLDKRSLIAQAVWSKQIGMRKAAEFLATHLGAGP